MIPIGGFEDDQERSERYDTSDERDAVAGERDLAALARDRAATSRDDEADGLDAEAARLAASSRLGPAAGVQRIIRRAARDRERAAADRSRAAADRSRAAAQRAEAARDRARAADDRRMAADDRAAAAAERESAALDELTGARRRGPGIAELQREIDRARRGTGRLVVAYIDVDGLKATNDTHGHAAGDARLKHIVGVLHARLRSYELIVRLGGDEFICALSDATLEQVRRRLREIEADLAAGADHGSISVGLAELAPGDSPIDLIERADAELLSIRAGRGANGRLRRRERV